jgi:uncharacterized protein YraI
MIAKALGLTAGLAAVVALSGTAMAATAVVQQAVNVRSGPGPEYGVVGVLSVKRRVEVLGCTPSLRWCRVSGEGTTGWVYSDYIAWDMDGARRPIRSAPPGVETPIVQYRQPPPAAAPGQKQAAPPRTVAATPAAPTQGTAALSSNFVNPPEQVRRFVATQATEPVYLEGEVEIGAGLPEVVPLYSVPDYGYRYAVVNGDKVLVDSDRRIVYVFP